MENEKKQTRRHLVDVIVISAIIFVAAISTVFLLVFRQSGDVAVVKVGSDIIGEYSLSKDGSYVLNGGTNTLVIENGTAYVINSQCPNHDCEKAGKIKYVGQFIECLPNELSVVIKGNSDGGVDFVS